MKIITKYLSKVIGKVELKCLPISYSTYMVSKRVKMAEMAKKCKKQQQN